MPLDDTVTTATRESAMAISPKLFRQVAAYIESSLGIRMSTGKIPLLHSRLQRRVRAVGCASLDQYLEFILTSGPGEAELLEFVDAITTNKTDFFREPGHFDFLTGVALPELDPGAGHRWDLRVWSAGCSSGQEAYTLAMVLSEFGAARGVFDFQILGTDVSRRVLQAAELAIYDATLVQPVAPALRQKYLMRSRDPSQARVRIVPELRDRARFCRLNFMQPSYDVGEFDVIFFRNVMIYFDKATQQKVVSRMCDQLRPGGFLFIGHSESLTGLSLPLQNVGTAVFRRR